MSNPLKVVGIVGHIGPYDPKSMEWSTYKGRFTFYLQANSITDAPLKRATLLTNIGDTAYRMLADLHQPDELSTNHFDTEAEVHRFLQRYRTIPHSTIGRTPSELLFGQTIRTTLDLIRPEVHRQVQGSQLRSIRDHDRTVRERFFNEIQEVLVRQYLGPRKWGGGQVLRQS